MKSLFLKGLILFFSSLSVYAQNRIEPVPKPNCTSYDDYETEEKRAVMKAAYAPIMANHEHRVWHNLWHSTRNGWHMLSKEKKDMLIAKKPQWKVTRPLTICQEGVKKDCRARREDGTCKWEAPVCLAPKYVGKENGAGEDFLYMHHMMIRKVQHLLITKGLACVTPWKTLPKPESPNWPLAKNPDKWMLRSHSKENYDRMNSWLKKYTDPKWLKGKTLGEVGFDVEMTLHNAMHMRWTEPSQRTIQRAIQSSNFSDAKKEELIISLKWRPDMADDVMEDYYTVFTNPDYDPLSDTYASHVNPIFWKLHGLVDSVIDHWLKANGYDEIALDCQGRSKCYQWLSKIKSSKYAHLKEGLPWVGGMPKHSHAQMPHHQHIAHDMDDVAIDDAAIEQLVDDIVDEIEKFVAAGNPNLTPEEVDLLVDELFEEIHEHSNFNTIIELDEDSQKQLNKPGTL